MRRWTTPHYRRSLASRVTLLTTMAVGVAVTGVAFAAYATVRMQSMNSLDESLHTRAVAAAHDTNLDDVAQDAIPTWLLGAADLKIIFLNTSDPSVRPLSQDALSTIGRGEVKVALGKQSWSARTIYLDKQRYRVVAVPADDGQALILAQSLASTDKMLDRLGLVMLLFGLAGMISAGLAGWALSLIHI